MVASDVALGDFPWRHLPLLFTTCWFVYSYDLNVRNRLFHILNHASTSEGIWIILSILIPPL